MKKSRYNVSLEYTPTQNKDETNQQRNQRKWKIICFTPPYSLNAKTHVEVVPQTSRLSFSTHKFHKIFNHKKVKISHCCMKNMGSIVSSHDKQVLQPRERTIDVTAGRNKAVP